MKRLLLVVILLASSCALLAHTDSALAQSSFHPPKALEAGNIVGISPCFNPNGTVVLDVVVTGEGTVQKVEVRRDIACLTQLAVQAVKGWRFAPARLAGRAIASRIPVAVTFSQLISFGVPDPLPPETHQTASESRAAFQPADVTHAVFPPSASVALVTCATVVLEVTLSARGQPEETRVIRDVPGLTASAEAAVGNFGFLPATLNGKPVESRIVLAFVFQPVPNAR